MDRLARRRRCGPQGRNVLCAARSIYVTASVLAWCIALATAGADPAPDFDTEILKTLDPRERPCQFDDVMGTHLGAAHAARRILASTYQSCRAATHVYDPEVDGSARGLATTGRTSRGTRILRIANPTRYVETHWALADRLPAPSPECAEPAALPVYAYGARPVLTGTPPEFDVFRDGTRGQACHPKAGNTANGIQCGGRTPTAGLDCSAFVSMALAAGGQRVEPGKDSFDYSSQRFFDLARKGAKKSCLALAMEGDLPRPGDLFTIANRHVVMIDSVGADPFGIQGLERCRDASPDRFDFRIIHSSPEGGGINIREAKEYFGRGSAFGYSMLRLARRACEVARGERKPGRPARLGASGLVRHAGTERPECRRPPDQTPAVVGEECAKACGS